MTTFKVNIRKQKRAALPKHSSIMMLIWKYNKPNLTQDLHTYYPPDEFMVPVRGRPYSACVLENDLASLAAGELGFQQEGGALCQIRKSTGHPRVHAEW
jgi:hypothetical protein